MAKFSNIATLIKLAARGSLTPLNRQYAAVAKIVDTLVNETTGIATVSMNKPPVNSLNLEVLVELTNTIRELEKNKCRGIILTSALPKVFSAGIDISQLYEPDMKQVEVFWRASQEVWSALYGTGLPTAAAVNGASPAGGCLLAISCDYRVFVEGKHTMGLSETQLGIVPPKWVQDMMINTVGYHQAEISLIRGSLYTPEEALKIGLVNELATDKTDAIVKCENYVSSYSKISCEARSATKLQLRRETLKWLEENRELDVQVFLTNLGKPEMQKNLSNFIKAMKKK